MRCIEQGIVIRSVKAESVEGKIVQPGYICLPDSEVNPKTAIQGRREFRSQKTLKERSGQ